MILVCDAKRLECQAYVSILVIFEEARVNTIWCDASQRAFVNKVSIIQHDKRNQVVCLCLISGALFIVIQRVICSRLHIQITNNEFS